MLAPEQKGYQSTNTMKDRVEGMALPGVCASKADRTVSRLMLSSAKSPPPPVPSDAGHHMLPSCAR